MHWCLTLLFISASVAAIDWNKVDAWLYDDESTKASQRCKIPIGLGIDCVEGVSVYHTLSDGFGVTRICKGKQMRGRQSVVNHANTCCVSSASICLKEMMMSPDTWTHTLYKASNPESTLHSTPAQGRVEITALRALQGDPAVPKLHAVNDATFHFGNATYEPPSLVIEYFNSESAHSYIVNPNNLWSHYMQHPSLLTANQINAKVNCLMRKAISIFDRLAKRNIFHGDTHLNNLVVSKGVEFDGCPEVKLVDWNNFQTISDPLASGDVALNQLDSPMSHLMPLSLYLAELTKKNGTISRVVWDELLREFKPVEVEALEKSISQLRKQGRVVPVVISPEEATLELAFEYISRFPIRDSRSLAAFTRKSEWVEAFYKSVVFSPPAPSANLSRFGCKVHAPVSPKAVTLLKYLKSPKSDFWRDYQIHPSLSSAVGMRDEVNCLMKKTLRQLDSMPRNYSSIHIIVQTLSFVNGCPEVEIFAEQICQNNPGYPARALRSILGEVATEAYIIQQATSGIALEIQVPADSLRNELGSANVPILLSPDDEFKEMVKSFYGKHPLTEDAIEALNLDRSGWFDLIDKTIIKTVESRSHVKETIDQYEKFTTAHIKTVTEKALATAKEWLRPLADFLEKAEGKIKEAEDLGFLFQEGRDNSKLKKWGAAANASLALIDSAGVAEKKLRGRLATTLGKANDDLTSVQSRALGKKAVDDHLFAKELSAHVDLVISDLKQKHGNIRERAQRGIELVNEVMRKNPEITTSGRTHWMTLGATALVGTAAVAALQKQPVESGARKVRHVPNVFEKSDGREKLRGRDKTVKVVTWAIAIILILLIVASFMLLVARSRSQD